MLDRPVESAFSELTRRIANQLSAKPTFFKPTADITVKAKSLGDGDILYEAGDDEAMLFIVESGWLIASVLLEDGARYVHRVYQKGDIIGLEDTNWSYATSTVEAVTECKLWSFLKEDQYDIFNADTHLGAALHGVSMNDQVVMIDRARSNSRSQGMERLGHFLLQLEARYRLNCSLDEETFDIPLTQLEVADSIGMSLVHTNKSMQRLISEGYIQRDRNQYKILRRAQLVRLTEFINRYDVTNRAWVDRLTQQATALD